MRPGLVPQSAPCIVSHNMALGGAQTAVLRMIQALPAWARERTTLYCQSPDMPLLEAAVGKHGFAVGKITADAPADPSCWVLSYGNLRDLPQRPTSLILHSWDDEGFRYVTRTYGHMRGLTVAGVSQQVLNRYADWIGQGGHTTAGLLPPPVTQWACVKGERTEGRIVVAWMGRPLESKGLMSLPYLLALDPQLIVRAWTGAETAGLEYTRRVQAQAMAELLKLADDLGVRDRLDLRPLDFDPFAYSHRLAGAHVLLGNSRREGFLMTAAEALSCGIPVVVTRTCGVADFVAQGVNGQLIDWDENPQRLARASYAAIRQAVDLDPMRCLQSVRNLSLQAGYQAAYGQVLARLTHTSLQHESPRVTVGVRIHKGMRIERLDEAVSSLAMQTYRRFKTVLLVDGPWEYGEMLSRRYDLPLLCTGLEPDITHCSALHRQAVAACDTEFYKPLDYDDQLLPDYLQRAVAAMDDKKLDVYGCRLMTLQDGQFSQRPWPHKALETMFTGQSGDNMLPHSSVLVRAQMCRKAGNYQERAIGLGADDYNLWFRIHNAGGKFWRDDVHNVVYRIHESNSLKIRKSRYGSNAATVLAESKSEQQTRLAIGVATAAESPGIPATPDVTQSAPVRSHRLAGAAAAAALALAALPAAAAAPIAATANPVSDVQPAPAGLLDRWVAMVKRTGKSAIDKLNKVNLPDPSAGGKDVHQGAGHAPIDLAPPHS
ncbi:MAG TPA: glycosyltransferase [Tepidisphaeraceae bacterium]|nr:glycosyltransferase [Tepidisphaeraceae bacterium]